MIIITFSPHRVDGPHLFPYVCQSIEHYSEHIVHSYMRQLVSALHWLHCRHTAHLDIKPENLMVHLTSPHQSSAAPVKSTPNHLPLGTLKLIDFGDAKGRLQRTVGGGGGGGHANAANNAAYQPQQLPSLTNLEFAAPEILLGQPLGEHTDSWCLGVLLYVFLSGVSPFLDDSAEETSAHILQCDFSFPDEYFAHISADARALLARLLVLSAEQRATMADCQQSSWFVQEPQRTPIAKTQLDAFNERRAARHNVVVATGGGNSV